MGYIKLKLTGCRDLKLQVISPVMEYLSHTHTHTYTCGCTLTKNLQAQKGYRYLPSCDISSLVQAFRNSPRQIYTLNNWDFEKLEL